MFLLVPTHVSVVPVNVSKDYHKNTLIRQNCFDQKHFGMGDHHLHHIRNPTQLEMRLTLVGRLELGTFSTKQPWRGGSLGLEIYSKPLYLSYHT